LTKALVISGFSPTLLGMSFVPRGFSGSTIPQIHPTNG
jgi:hypothetical protein